MKNSRCQLSESGWPGLEDLHDCYLQFTDATDLSKDDRDDIFMGELESEV